MKSTLLTVVACFCLLILSAWAVVTPALAATATATCKDGSSVSCSGTNCESHDSTSTTVGYCMCSSPNGSLDRKTCDDGPPILD